MKQHERSTCVHKKLPIETQSTNTATTPENFENTKVQTQHMQSEIEIPPFFKNVPLDLINAAMLQQKAHEERHGGMEDKILNILNENEILKKRLDFSKKIITLLQQRMNFESIAMPYYPPLEDLMRFQLENHQDN